MKFAPKLAVTVALVSTLFQPTFAADAPATGVSSADPRQVIDARIGRIEEALKAAVAGGRLSTDEADNYRSQLGQISEEEAQYAASVGKLGPIIQARIDSALARMEKRIASSQHDRRVAIFDFGLAEDNIRNGIAQAKSQNRLSDENASRLQNELKSIVDLQHILAEDGLMSYGDALVVSYAIDRLVGHMGSMLTEPSFNLPPVDQVANDANQAVNKIPGEQSIALHKQFDDLIKQLNSARNIKSPEQRAAQELYLSAQFELLRGKAELAAVNKVVAVAPKERVQQIDFALADAFVNGKLSPQEAHELRAELQGIINEMGVDASAMTAEKTNRIALELERLAGQLERWQHSPQKIWPGFDAFQAAFDQRVDEASKATRITGDQLAYFRAEADKIAKAEETKRSANGGKLSANDALDLAMQIEHLSVQLHHDAKDRDVTVPDTDALQKELDRLITDGIVSGRLAADGSLLTERLNHLAELRANYEKSTTGMDNRARLAIAHEIASTIAVIEQDMHRDVPNSLPLDLRLDHLGDVVSNAVACGLISIERGAQYRSAVDTIYAHLAADRKSDSGLNAKETIDVANDIDLLTAQLTDELRESAVFAPLVSQGMDDLRLQIGNAVANGRLTIAQGNELIAEIDRKSSALNLAAGSQGGLSHGEGLRLAYDVQRIKSAFETQLHDHPVPVADIGLQTVTVDTRLANALAAGQLTVPESQQYRNLLERIANNAAGFRASDGGLTMPEAIALQLELEQLNKVIDNGIRKETGARNVDAREADLKQRIKGLVAGGKLSQRDADNLLADLDRIEESEAAFRVSDEGLNYAEALTLTLDLDRLSTRIDTMSKGTVSTLQQPKSR